MEKRLGVQRNKMIGATDGDPGVDGPSLARARRGGSSSSEGEQDEAGKQQEDEEDDGDVDGDNRAVFRESVLDRFMENGIKLSGPVTDL